MRNLMVIIGAALLMSLAGCAYFDRSYAYPDDYYYGRPVAHEYYYRPYGYQYRPYPHRRYYDYGYWYDGGYEGRSNARG